MSDDLSRAQWRKSTYSGNTGNCAAQPADRDPPTVSRAAVTHGVRVARTDRYPWNLTSLSLSRRVSRADSFTDTTLSWASLLLGGHVKLKGGTGGRARRHAPAGHSGPHRRRAGTVRHRSPSSSARTRR